MLQGIVIHAPIIKELKRIYTISNLFWLTNLYELELSSYLIIEPWLQHMVVKQKICWSWYQSTIHTLCRLMNTFLPKSFCSLEHFASQLTLLSTLCTSAHFNHRSTLLHGTLCSLEHLTPWNTLLPGTLCFKCSREQRMLRRTIYKLAKCAEKQSVPRRRVF